MFRISKSLVSANRATSVLDRLVERVAPGATAEAAGCYYIGRKCCTKYGSVNLGKCCEVYSCPTQLTCNNCTEFNARYCPC